MLPKARLRALAISVFLALFLDLVSYLRGGVERVLGPIVFADGTRRRGELRHRLLSRRFLVVSPLRDKEATKNDHDENNDNGSHSPGRSRLRAIGAHVAARGGQW